MKAELARVKKKLEQADTIIDVQRRVPALLVIVLPETHRNESNS